jgi:hypothetical protein
VKFELVIIEAISAILFLNSGASAIVLNCPPTVKITAAEAPFPWSGPKHNPAQLSFSQASYSCSNGTCTLSCSYTAPSQACTLLVYKVPPGVCTYTSEGTAFSCSSLPAPRHHRRHID